MSLEALHQFLTLYTWFGLLILLLFWGLITRHYQRLSRRGMAYRALLLPGAVLTVLVVRLASRPFAPASPLEEGLALLAAGGMSLLIVYGLFRMLRRS